MVFRADENGTASHAGVVLASVATAYLLKRFRVVDAESGGKAVSTIVLFLTLPATTFSVISGIQDFQVEYLYMAAFCFAYTMLLIVPYNYVAIKYFSGKSMRVAALLTGGLQGFGIGQFGYPIVQMLWGDKGLAYVVFFDLANAIPTFVISYGFHIYAKQRSVDDSGLPRNTPVSSDSKRDVEKSLLDVSSHDDDDNPQHPAAHRNGGVARKVALKLVCFPPIWAFVLGLTFCLTSVAMPAYVKEQLSVFSGANPFLVYVILGFYLDFGTSHGARKTETDIISKEKGDLHFSTSKLIKYILIPRLLMGSFAGTVSYCFFKTRTGRVPPALLVVCYLFPSPPAAIAYAVEYFPRNANLLGNLVNITAIVSFGVMLACHSFLGQS